MPKTIAAKKSSAAALITLRPPHTGRDSLGVKTGTRLYGQCPIIARIAATRMIARYAPFAVKPRAFGAPHAASGLDRSARPGKQADRAVDANL